MMTYTDWLTQPGALWYGAQGLLLMVVAYATGCLFGCWFRRIQPQPVEVVAAAPRVAAPVPTPKPGPVVAPRAAQPEASGGRLRKAFEEPSVPASPPRQTEPALTAEAIRAALAEKRVEVVAAPPPPPAQDDLKRIKGIGPEFERKLNALGIARYRDIVHWTAADVDRMGTAIGSDLRITHENWIEQAAILAAGGETMFSRRVDRKEVLASPKDTWMPVAPTQVERQGMVSAQATPHDPSVDPRKAATAVATTAAEIGRRVEPPIAPGVHRPATSAAGSLVLKPLEGASAGKPAASTDAAGPATTTPTPAPAKSTSARHEPDDLKRIRRITPEIEKQLNALGVNRYSQIASWSPQAVEKASSVLSVGGTIAQENWVEQAMILARGGDTDYSRRLKQGALPIAAPPVVAPPGIAGAAAQSAGRSGPPDDLKRIRGVGIVLETKLNALGIRTYADIAQWSQADVAHFGDALEIPGRIVKENWVGQAQVLASGQATEFSNRVDRGEVALKE